MIRAGLTVVLNLNVSPVRVLLILRPRDINKRHRLHRRLITVTRMPIMDIHTPMGIRTRTIIRIRSASDFTEAMASATVGDLGDSAEGSAARQQLVVAQASSLCEFFMG